MYKIAICDDNHESVNKYAKIITLYAKKNQIEILLSFYYCGEELLFNYYDESFHADVIYLDILMDKSNGMEIARKLRDGGCRAQIVFLSNSPDYVYDAFDVDAIQYFIKDKITETKFESAFLKAIRLAEQKEEEVFVCEFDGVKNMIPIDSISYFEIWKRVVTVHYDEDKFYKFYSSIDHLEKYFASKNFVRIHRSYLVNLPYISQFEAQKLKLKTGEIIPVGITYLQSSKEAFSNYISRFHILDL